MRSGARAHPLLLTLLLAAGLLSAGLAGCGSASHGGGSGPGRTGTVSATAYVTTLCEAVGPFEKDVVSDSGALSDTGSVSDADAKHLLAGYLGTLASDSATAVSRLRAAGVPAVGSGRQFATTLLNTFTRLQRALTRADGLAESLPTSSPTAFKSAATNLGTAVKASVGELGAGLSTKSNPTLDATAAKVPACHSL